MRQFLLALGGLVLLASSVSAGPIREWLAARRGASACSTSTCSPAVTAPAAAKPVAAPVAVASPVNCPGGKCEAPASRRGIFGLRR